MDLQQKLFQDEYAKSILFEKHRNRKRYNQYFTPEFAVQSALSLINGVQIENVIDPAVGNGVFLKITSEKWSNAKLFGIDIDESVIANLRKQNLVNYFFYYANSLQKNTWKISELDEIIIKGGFDLVVGNPPFNSWFHRIEAKEILSNYELARNNGNLRKSQAIEILFLEIFIKLARKGGVIVIVLPDGVLANPQYRYVREFILKRTRVLHIINLPRNIFERTSAKTSILILKKHIESNSDYFLMLHDLEKNGQINNNLRVNNKELLKRMDYYYYHNMKESTVHMLINKGIRFNPLKDFAVYCKTGKTLYGEKRAFSKNGLRFLHATNITDIGINYKKDEKFVETFSRMDSQKAHVTVGDILFVRVGVGCAGRIAIVDSKEDEGVATDYIHIFRVKNINPYFLVVYLKTRFGKDSINLLKHGVGTVSINKTDLMSLPIPSLPEKFQNRIEREFRIILSKYRMNQNNSELTVQFNSLIYYLESKLTL